jgi:hypothetical protein
MADRGMAVTAPAGDRRRSTVLRLAVFDIAGPLALYYLLTSNGLSTVLSLILSGTFPAVGITWGLVRDHHLDVIGLVVLIGILTGTVVGLISGSARLVLVDGTVPTAVIGIVCLGSLSTSRPMMYRLALEGMGPDSPRGREFAARWEYPGFRGVFRVITLVWGLVFLFETAVQVVIIETSSAGTAKTTSNLMPVLVAGLAVTWTCLYGLRKRRAGEHLAMAHAQSADDPANADVRP